MTPTYLASLTNKCGVSDGPKIAQLEVGNCVAMWELYRLQNQDCDKWRVRRNATKEKACEQISSRARPPPGAYSEVAEVVDLEPGNNDPLMDCGSFDLLFNDSNSHVSKE